MSASATLMLHTTGRCNLECQHCYMEGSPRRREQLPFEWMEASIRAAPSLGIGAIYLTGGEPLMYDGIEDLIRVASDVDGLILTVNTNGMLLSVDHARRLRSANAQVHISIDGTPGFHDTFRRHRGAFHRTERGVGYLVAEGVPVTVVTTITTRNLNQFDAIANWAMEHGAMRLLVQPLLRLGRAVDIAGDRLSTEELNQLVMRTSDLTNRTSGGIAATVVGTSRQFMLAHPCAAYVCNGGGCHRSIAAEIKKVVVRENGTILPEATNLDPRYAIGDVNDGPLATQLERFFATGWAAFDQLCRTTYDEYVPTWPDVIVPWDQLLAERSSGESPDDSSHGGCGVEGLAERLSAAVPKTFTAANA
jgi:Fe-coproporphyrin III synthase